jgi:hypothetical protein
MPAGYIARASEGRSTGRIGKKKGPKSADELRAYNAQFSRFAKTDTKRSLKFASKSAFQNWFQGLSENDQQKYGNWKAQEVDEDGRIVVYVYKDLNNNDKYDPDQDQLVAVNGQWFVRSNAAERRHYAIRE